jgi:hypothetical protein
LVWLTSSVGDHWGRIELALSSSWGGGQSWTGGPAPLSDTLASQLTDDWRVMVERLQVLAARAAAEARRRGLADVAGPHDAVPWTVVPERPPRWHELMAIAGIPRGEPPFPSDPSFADVRPAARDRAGGETGARRMGALSTIWAAEAVTEFPRRR